MPTTDVAQIANWVTTDSNDSTKKFTFNIGGYNAATPYTYLGGTAGTALTGTLPGQFVYGNPTLKSLAVKPNLTNIKKLYGFRTNSDIDLSNYLNVTVTINWDAGGVGSYTGFIAKSSTGDSEAWSLLTAGNLPIAAATAGSLSFNDSTNTILMGKPMMRFALIFGSGSTKLALRNLSITVKGFPRKTLDSVGEGYLDTIHEYAQNEPIDFTKFHLKAFYSYPTTTQLFSGSDARVSFYDNDQM